MGTAKNRYQLELPVGVCKRVPAHFEATGQRKNFKRYWTEKAKSLLADMMEAEDRQLQALRDTMRKIFNKFDER